MTMAVWLYSSSRYSAFCYFFLLIVGTECWLKSVIILSRDHHVCQHRLSSSPHTAKTDDAIENQTILDADAINHVTEIENQQEHSKFMRLALQQAKKAGRKGEVPIGAIIAARLPGGDTRILSQAYNLVETKKDASAHAELLALRKAAKFVNNWRLPPNTTLYSTLEPCPMCLAAAQAFRVSQIVYGAPDLRLGAIETYVNLLEPNHPFHNIEDVVSGISANESSSLLKDFFRRRRQEKKRQPITYKQSNSKALTRLRSVYRWISKHRNGLSGFCILRIIRTNLYDFGD